MMKKYQELTRAEFGIMQVVWARERVLVRDVLDSLPDPKPAYNTVSTIIRILEKKGFIGHKAYGRTYEYFPLVLKDAYTRGYMSGVLNSFFGGSVSQLVSFLSEGKAISAQETDAVLKMLSSTPPLSAGKWPAA